ncbi:fumarylacetoacetate hydrolase family protein [Cohnella candidum]|uniref:FAA hydrolase family protein n=1 Tax=Cohnella candidum TaxID=2674991 RepID=A0A3G3JTV5_9BACL|nr:fumarylacetoacetate hydrolase family protein [Cohnella candidum]AYQ71658.1 FAA hydrolase family protein [Cohnella candidum]
MEIRNVFCVGRNYRLHAAELGNDVPTSPMLFMKPSHAAVTVTDGVLLVPGNRGAVHYETELVVRVGRPYEPGIAPDELFSHLTVGLDLTLREVQDGLKAKGHPWLAAKGFRNSAPLGTWIGFPGETVLADTDFGLNFNAKEVQRGNVKDMVFGLRELAEFTGQAYGLGPGDVLFTGTPAGVGSLSEGDELEWWFGDRTLGSAKVAMEGK